MNKTTKLAQVSLLFILAAGLGRASLLSCGTNLGVVTVGGQSPDIVCGGLSFGFFELTGVSGGAPGIVDILGAQFDTVSQEVYMQLNPNLQSSQDEQLLFQAYGGIDQLDLSVGGVDANVTETACQNPISTTGALAFMCTNATGTQSVAPLGQITVSSGTTGQPISSNPFTASSPIYIEKDIMTDPGGENSIFTESFHISPTGTPEPVSLILMGSGLICVGLLRKRMRG